MFKLKKSIIESLGQRLEFEAVSVICFGILSFKRQLYFFYSRLLHQQIFFYKLCFS